MRTEKQHHNGISLIEVLAAIFVVSIGLLGVLAVIPFGAFQVSKAQHAEYAANMLVNATEEIFIREMAKPDTWASPPTTLDDTKFVWFEPRDMDPAGGAVQIDDASAHIVYVSVKDWQEIMRGQDDLDYTMHPDRRPDLSKQGGNIRSSGKYSWFFTFLPLPLTSSEKSVPVDVLACYNRVPSDDQQEVNAIFTRSRRGGTFTFLNAEHLELLTQTKYVFVTWEEEAGSLEGGAWCKIVFLDKESSAPKIIVTSDGDLSGLSDGDDTQVYIPSGVLYHKRIGNVPIR
jgi:type II secretory pathway pseudopilin PulG